MIANRASFGELAFVNTLAREPSYSNQTRTEIGQPDLSNVVKTAMRVSLRKASAASSSTRAVYRAERSGSPGDIESEDDSIELWRWAAASACS